MNVWKAGLLGFFFAALAVLFVWPIEADDVWWHLATGRWILEHGAVPAHDPFAYAEASSWTHTQWLGSVVLYKIYDVFDLAGLRWFRALWFASMITFFMIYALRRNVPTGLTALLGVCIAMGLDRICLLRPLMFNLLFIQIFLVCLLHHRRTGSPRPLFILPFLGPLWFNLHMGSFVYGLALFAIFIPGAWQSGGWMRVRPLMVTALLFLASFWINPYGAAGFAYPFQVFFADSLKIHAFADYIRELKPPVFVWSTGEWWFWCLLGFTGILLYRGRSRDITLWLLIAIPLMLFLKAQRAADFFVLGAAYAAIELMATIDKRSTYVFRPAFNTALALVIVGSLLVTALRYREEDAFHRIYHAKCPVETVETLKATGAKGIVLSSDNVGGFILWEGYPGLRPVTDGRWFHLEDLLALIDRPAEEWEGVRQRIPFNYAILDVEEPLYGRLLAYVRSRPDWRLVYREGSYETYVGARHPLAGSGTGALPAQ